MTDSKKTFKVVLALLNFRPAEVTFYAFAA